jgi:hypothetical protein
MSDRRVFRWATTSARLLAATIASVAAVIAIVTAISFPWPTIVREPVSVLATPAPAASVIVCDGGLLTLGRDLEDASDIAIATTQSVISGAAEGAPPPLETRLTTAGLAPGDGPLVFTAPPEGRRRVDVAASGSATVVAPDISGFAASACRPPLMESWLVGGSAATGAADIVIVSNPGTVAATVQLTAFGANGPITPPGGADLVVPPATQRLIPLAGLVLGESAPVIRVSAVGAPVHASLQTSITRTLTPGGADQVGPVQAPEPRQTIAGVTVTAAPAAGEESDAPTVLRMLSPGAAATATVTVTSVGGGQPEPPRVIPLSGGQPTEIELGGLPVGVYTVEVAADQPVVAAVWQTTGFDEGSDFAWYSASPLVSAPSLFATPAGPPPSLTIVNPDDEEAVVSITSADGSFRLEVTVPAGGSTIARLSPRTVYEFDPGRSGIRAGLSLAGDGALAGITVWPADAAAPPILVYP